MPPGLNGFDVLGLSTERLRTFADSETIYSVATARRTTASYTVLNNSSSHPHAIATITATSGSSADKATSFGVRVSG